MEVFKLLGYKFNITKAKEVAKTKEVSKTEVASMVSLVPKDRHGLIYVDIEFAKGLENKDPIIAATCAYADGGLFRFLLMDITVYIRQLISTIKKRSILFTST